jgi:hypothetical protein
MFAPSLPVCDPEAVRPYKKVTATRNDNFR